MSTFFQSYQSTKTRRTGECPANHSVVIEDDGKVAYAYLLDGKNIIGDVWLYNQIATPEKVDWKQPGRVPFLNPKMYVGSAMITEPLIEGRDEVLLEWSYDQTSALEFVDVWVRGSRYARLLPGAKPGCSLGAAKDGPLAKLFGR